MRSSSPFATATLIATTLVAAPVSAQFACTDPTPPSDCATRFAGTPIPFSNAAAPAMLDLANATTIEISILGHSENRGYHRFLQPLLDQNPPLGKTYIVTNRFISGHEAWRWATPGQRGYNAIQSMLTNRQHPLIVLGLFSNNVNFPVTAPNVGDPNFVKFAQDLNAIADHAHDGGNGAAMVYLSNHRYKPTNLLPAFHETCAVGHALALAEAAGKTYVKPGPEQYYLHACCYPSCYAPDNAHTNRSGDELMAEAWYALLVRELTGCAIDSFGTGTPGTGGTIPTLRSGGGFPVAGNSAFELQGGEVRASAPIAYVFGTSRVPGPLLLINPLVSIGASAAPDGTHALPLPISSDPGVHGTVLHAQLLSIDPAAGLGISSSQGVTLRACASL